MTALWEPDIYNNKYSEIRLNQYHMTSEFML